MMQRTTLLLAAAAGSMIAAGSASAAFTGLDAESFVGADWVANGYDESALDTYRVYATFDTPISSVLAVGDNADDGIEFSLRSSNGAFVNDAAGSDFAPNPTFLPFAPAVRWDTYITIGEAMGMGPGGVAMTFGTPGFASQAAGLTGDFTLDNAGFFQTMMPLGEAVNGRVLVAQITVTEGATVTGENWVITGLDVGFPFEALGSFTTAIPAPGALALLGLAGLVGRRRRG